MKTIRAAIRIILFSIVFILTLGKINLFPAGIKDPYRKSNPKASYRGPGWYYGIKYRNLDELDREF
jgi:hypothetical protein